MIDKVSFSIDKTENAGEDRRRILKAVDELGLIDGKVIGAGGKWYVVGERLSVLEIAPPIDMMNGRVDNFFKKVKR